MKGNTASVMTLAERCKSILASNWQGRLNTVKADAKGSKGDVYTSKVKYILRRGKPYIWVPENDLHNVNTVIDERGSFSIASPFPGPIATLLKSMEKVPTRVALTGEVVPLKDQKAKSVAESLKEVLQTEEKMLSEASHAVTAVMCSSNHVATSRSLNLKALLDESESHVVYKFNVSSCMFIDGNGGTHEVDVKEVASTKADILAPYSAKLIDGINRSAARRRALVLFCLVYLNANARDAFMFSIDRKGFDVLGKIPSRTKKGDVDGYSWKQLRFTLKVEAHDMESFCSQLVQMEEEAVKNVSSYSGLA